MRIDFLKLKLKKIKSSAKEADGKVPHGPGYYAIHLCNKDALPSWFTPHLGAHNIIYIGIAEVSLQKRLVKGELWGKSSATFFRSLGAALGYKPPKGSLRHRKNQYNYNFNPQDTKCITDWINKNLAISWHEELPFRETEKELIQSLTPPFNTTYNPNKLEQLEKLRSECRKIAISD